LGNTLKEKIGEITTKEASFKSEVTGRFPKISSIILESMKTEKFSDFWKK
jgi:hypothetical protein